MISSGTVPAGSSDWKYIDECISKIASGDKDAFRGLYENIRVPVYSFALSILKNSDDAEDALEDCLVKIWNSAPSYRSMGKPMAWIITIAKNICLLKIRDRSKIEGKDPVDTPYLTSPGADVTAESKLILKECMDSLSDDERQTVVLHAVSGLKHKEIAEIMDKPLSTVLSIYNRAIKKLREALNA